MELTTKQRNRLKSVEQYLYTIKNAQYKRQTTMTENELVADILDEVTGKHCNRNYSCGACVYDIFNQVAQLYYKVSNEPETPLKTNKLRKNGRNKGNKGDNK